VQATGKYRCYMIRSSGEHVHSEHNQLLYYKLSELHDTAYICVRYTLSSFAKCIGYYPPRVMQCVLASIRYYQFVGSYASALTASMITLSFMPSTSTASSCLGEKTCITNCFLNDAESRSQSSTYRCVAMCSRQQETTSATQAIMH
jgi:hypothetical protein